jgi:glycosyltransferase involved in cell wall biosynthesis
VTKNVVFHASSAHPAADNRIFHKECTALSESGLEVHLSAVADADQTKNGIHIHALPPEKGRLRRAAMGNFRIWKLLRDVKPDLLHVHDPELIPLALLWRTLYRRPTVYDSHEDLPKDVMGKAYLPMPTRRIIAAFARLLESSAGRWLSMIVAATPPVARNYPTKKVVIVENFPWLANFTNVTPITAAKPRDFVYVGGLSRARGVFEMFSAIKMSTLTPPLTLTIAGIISPEIERALQEKSQAPITYLGNLPVGEMQSVISDSIAGLVVFLPQPNYLECQPTKLFEYMAAGRPFVASNFPYFMQMFGPFDCGLFVDPCDPVAIRDAMEILANDLPMAEAMGQRGRSALEKYFTFETQATKLCFAVKELLQS